jgi:hypothetical protein
LIDTGLNGGYELLGRRKAGAQGSSKGSVVTRADLEKYRKQFRLLTALYPLLWAVAKLDVLLPLQQGYKLMVKARLVA